MRIVNAELLIPTADEIKRIVKTAYEAGRARGREEAKLELQGFVTPPDGGDRDAGRASARSERETAAYRMFTAGKC
jgi:hypothetical protein